MLPMMAMMDCEAGGGTGWERSKSKWWPGIGSQEAGYDRAKPLDVHRSQAMWASNPHTAKIWSGFT
jgi:hypothetical protein